MTICRIFELLFDHGFNAGELFQYLFEEPFYFYVFAAAAAHDSTSGGIDQPQKTFSLLAVLKLLKVGLLRHEATSIFT